MRNRFGEQLERLHVEMIQMGALCEDAISAAAKALLKGDEDLARSAQEAEREIDQKEREVENLCLKLLLQQQPVASDLREISSALKMISDLERIGDQAADIAELTRFVRLPDGMGRQRIEEMAQAVIQMVTDSVDSFVKRDLDLARQVCREDDQVDELFKPGEEGADRHDRLRRRLRRAVAGYDHGGQVSGAHRRPCHQRGGVGGVRHHRHPPVNN